MIETRTIALLIIGFSLAGVGILGRVLAHDWLSVMIMSSILVITIAITAITIWAIRR